MTKSDIRLHRAVTRAVRRTNILTKLGLFKTKEIQIDYYNRISVRLLKRADRRNKKHEQRTKS